MKYKTLIVILTLFVAINSVCAAVPLQQNSLRPASTKQSLAEFLLAIIQNSPRENGIPIAELAMKAGIRPEELELFTGINAAKVKLSLLRRLQDAPMGKTVIFTSMTSPDIEFGMGKTTCAIGATQGLGLLDVPVALVLRQGALAPTAGKKGPATGTGESVILPKEAVKYHFTGDFPAVEAAHNLLMAMLLNHIYYGNKLEIDINQIKWAWAMDLDERGLRKFMVKIVRRKEDPVRVATGEKFIEFDGRFIVTPASEVMAVLAAARDEQDLYRRLGNIIVAYDKNQRPITAKMLNAVNAMAVLLQNTIKPNLVQTKEGQIAMLHTGCYANVALGNSSVISLLMLLKLVGPEGIVITEGGFAAENGFLKFCEIITRQGGITPDLAALVVTTTALKIHGGLSREEAMQLHDGEQALRALSAGFENLDAHIKIVKKLGVPVLVVINRFPADEDAEIDLIKQHYVSLGIEAAVSNPAKKGGEGSKDVARAIVEMLQTQPAKFEPLYDVTKLSIKEKITETAVRIYGADPKNPVNFSEQALADIERLERLGFGDLPICVAKTAESLTTKSGLVGAPTDWTMDVKGVGVSAGAEFLVVYTDDQMLMFGMPETPKAEFWQVPVEFIIDKPLDTTSFPSSTAAVETNNTSSIFGSAA